jgi:ATP-dependent RNA helicase HelY
MSTPAERMAASRARTSHKLTEKFSLGFDFPLDDFQIKSLHCVEDGKGLLVAAPTGAGKTVVG